MEILFTLDRQDYTSEMPIIERFCVRAVIMRAGALLVQRSAKGEYKLPGGGIESGEDRLATLKREVSEETGYCLRAGSDRLIGEVIEKRRDVFDPDMVYLNHTYFYLCEIDGEQKELALTPEEIARGYTAVWEMPERIIEANDAIQKEYWRRRDTLFLKWYREHGYYS